MNAGDLNNRVTIQQQGPSKDALGQLVTTWTDVATVWANIRHNSGIETIRAGADASTVRASIRIRYKSGLNAGMRVVAGSAVYLVKAVMPDMGGKEFVDLACEMVT